MQGRWSDLYVLLMGLIFIGCATYQHGAIEVRSIAEYPNRTTVEGISVAAEPYDTPEKAKQGFYDDVTSEGFYPVNLIIQNDTNDRVIVLRETVELIDSSGNIYRPVRSTIMFNSFEKNKIAYALLGFGIFSYMSAEEANRKMETDWRDKEIPDQVIILSGRKTNGFVYFRLPKGRTTKGHKLRVEAERMDTKKRMQLELTL